MSGCSRISFQLRGATGLVLALLLTAIEGPAQSPHPPDGAVHTVRQIQELGNERARAGYPAHLEGVVTYADPAWGLLFVRGETGPIYIDAHGLGLWFAPGTAVTVEGVTAAGDISPVIAHPKIRAHGRGVLPIPDEFTLGELNAGKADSELVQTHGVLRPGKADLDRISYRIFDGDTSSLVVIPQTRGVRAEKLIGATVRLRGVNGVELSPSGERLGAQLFVSSLDDVVVEEAAVTDALALPPDPIASIGSDAVGMRFRRPTHVRGTVIWVRPGLICVEDRTGVARVEPGAGVSVRPGVTVDAAGYITNGIYSLALADADIRPIAGIPATVPDLALSKASEVAEKPAVGKPVRLSGRLLEEKETARDHTFILSSGRITFVVALTRTGPNSETVRLPPGSDLDVTGLVVSKQAASAAGPRFVIRVLSESDIASEGDRWLTTRKTLTALGALLLVVAVAMLWVSQLRRTVRRQTGLIRARLENQLQLETEYRRLFERNLAAVFRWTPQGTIVDCNESFARMLGYLNAAQVLGRSYWDLSCPDQKKDVAERQQMEKLLAAEGISNRNAMLRRQDGGLLCLLENVTPVRNSEGVLYETTALDVTELRRKEADLQRARDNALQQALNDALTGLPNRRLFSDHIGSLTARRDFENSAIAQAPPVALLYLDLDGFKLVNDSFGHSTGDALLVQVASRLRSCFGPADMIARLGGDEFTILMCHPHPREAARKAADSLLSALVRPFLIGEHEILIGGSIGVSLFPENSGTAEELLQQADSAMYAAKRSGRNRVEFFTSELGSLLRERTNLELQLRGAIGRGEISIHYQPEFDMVSNTLIRFEALARWNHPTLGSVPPASFVPIAEESGVIVALGAFVLEKACLEAMQWRSRFRHPVQVAVNVSSVQFRRDGFVDEVAGILRSTGLPPELLQLELTESVMLGSVRRSAEIMLALKGLGITLAVDDFGTGYSSLSYLHALPFDALKIDRAFIHNVDSRPESEAMVTSIVALAQNIGIRVIVEGVETASELQVIQRIGGNEMQGFLLGRPTGNPGALMGYDEPAGADFASAEALEPV